MAHFAGPPRREEPWDWSALRTVALRETQRVLRSSQEAEDAAQEALIRAFRNRAQCSTPDAPKAWIRTIARREAYRLFALRRAKGETTLTEESGRIEDDSDLILDRLNAYRRARLITRDDRALLVRRHVFDQTSTEIAADLGIPATTVRVRLHRATQRVRQRVALED